MKNKKNIAPPVETEEEEIEVLEEQSTGQRILSGVVNTILVLAIILATVCTYVSYVSTSGNGVPSILGIRVFSIQTESMYPTLLPGDLIFDVGVDDPAELQVGDIITYWTVINGERVLNTHRIYEIYDGGGYRLFGTKGDNNTIADALTVHESEIVGKYSTRIAGVGKVFDYLQTSTGFLIVVVIPVFIFFLFYLVQFFRVLFEYQNVKNRIKYEQERGRTEDLIAEQKRAADEAKEKERAALEAELRERLKAELLASMASEMKAAETKAEPAPVEEKPAPAPAEEKPAAAAQEPVQEEAAAEPEKEEAPAEETPVAETSSEEEAPVEEEAPADEETPADEEAPAQEETSVEAAAAEDVAPAAEESEDKDTEEKNDK